MTKKFKVPKIWSKENFRIPACEECGEDLVKFHGKWLCPDDMKISVRALPGWEPEDVPFGALYPNREARRQK